MVLDQVLAVGLVHHEVLPAGVAVHRDGVSDRTAPLPLHGGAADAAARADGHLDEALLQAPLLDVVQGGQYILDAVYHQVGVVGGIALHGAQDAAGGGEQPGTALLQVVLPLLHGDTLLLQPVGELLEGEDAIGVARVGVGLGFFGDAGPDEHGLGVGVLLLDLLAVGLHGRHHRSQIGQHLGVIFLYQRIHRMAAGGDDDLLLALVDDVFILGLHNGRAHSRLFRSGKSQLLQGLLHGGNGGARVVGHKRGSHAGNDRAAL